jgi:hypothetical protein
LGWDWDATNNVPVIRTNNNGGEDEEDEINFEKTYNLTRFKAGKLIVNSISAYISLDAESVIKNGIVLKVV